MQTTAPLTARPLLAVRSDQRFFAGRTRVLDRLTTAIDHGWNILVTGERGVGKTSLVRRAAYLRREAMNARKGVVFVSGGGATSALSVLVDVAARVAEAEGAAAGRADDSSLADVVTSLAGPGQRGQTARPLVVLDDLSGEVGHELFGTLRDELWQVGLQWMAVVDTAERETLLRAPADSFFEATVRLEQMSLDEAEQMLVLRLGELPRGWQDVVADLESRSPRYVLQTIRELQLSGTAASRHGVQEQEHALAELGKPAQMVFVELQVRGSASASDRDLQERLGWTRSRLTQVLNQLHGSGLVEREVAKASGAGRPRTIFRPRSPAQLLEWRRRRGEHRS